MGGKGTVRVEVYYNIHKNCLSLRPIPGGRVSHMTGIVLSDVKFAVQPAGREKVRQEKRKNVHAFVRGTFIVDESRPGYDDALLNIMSRPVVEEVTYNPYLYDLFVRKNDLAYVTWADHVAIVGKKIYAVNPR